MKKLNSLSELKSFIDPSEVLPNNSSYQPSSSFVKQHLEAHYSKKGRAGKPVTVIKCFKGTKN